MQFDDVILGRRSIRGYKPDPVPPALIKEIIALAMRAPSSMNTQPWNFYVITGAPLDKIRAGNTERNLAGVPHSREFRIGDPFAGKHRERQIGVAKQLFSAMGIARAVLPPSCISPFVKCTSWKSTPSKGESFSFLAASKSFRPTARQAN